MALQLSTEVFLSSPEGLNSTCVLVSGSEDAVLVDVPLLISDGRRLVEMVQASGKHLTTIFVTHAHPDHWFTLPVLIEAFPGARVAAQPVVAAEIESIREKKYKQWKPVFGDEVADALVGPAPWEPDVVDLEGERLELIYVPQADCKHATTVWVPSVSTLVASDLGFNGTHVYVAEHDADARAQFLANVEKMAELGADTIVPGHKVAGLPDDAGAVISWTADYLRTFERMLADSPSEALLLARIAEEWGDIPLEFAVPLNVAAALRGEYF
jgi:glyoxylase-like metal-dependent hydrolase (beta-lactamase superfamily II)